ncbi:MAG: class I SAM-dependent methyltransferase [Streptosporangiaceae bacterium]
MPGGYEWDESLYAGSAAYYAIGRMPYPAALAEALRPALGLDGSGRLLDVGCGPGSLTLLLAPFFREAVGIDADPDMIAAARAAAARSGQAGVSWRHMRAEQLPGSLGAFTVVTFAQSFHWVDQGRVAPAVRGLLPPGGACVHLLATTHRGVDDGGPLPHPRPPRGDIDDLVAGYLGPVRRAGRSLIPDGPPSQGDDALRAAGFSGPERIEVPGGAVLTRSEDEVVASVFSLSSATPMLFGDRAGAFEQELRELLRSVSPDGRFSERLREMTADVWRA